MDEPGPSSRGDRRLLAAEGLGDKGGACKERTSGLEKVSSLHGSLLWI
jgi:hypothetical protein